MSAYESIRPLQLEDIMGLERYESEREEIRRRTIALKKTRRVALGPEITLVFENHATMFFQIHEMLRAEQISDVDAIRDEMAVYNDLLPEPGQLSATLLVEITDRDRIRQRLNELVGIDEAIRMQIGDRSVPADFEPGRSREDKISAVQYVRFSIPPELRERFTDPSCPVRIVADHPSYQAEVSIEGDTRASLAEDLREHA